MKSRYKAFGIIIMMMIAGLVFVGCDTGNGGGGSGGNNAPPTSRKLTITGLDDYNGLYIFAQGENYEGTLMLIAGGGMNISDYTAIGTRISNGQATLNVWEGVFEEVYDEYYDEYYDALTGLKSYGRSDQNLGFYVMIFSGSTYSGGSNEAAEGQIYPVNFSNGSATAAISNIVPVVQVNLNGIEGSLNAYHDEEDNDGYIDIDFYDYAVAIEGYTANYKQDFKLYIDGNLVSSDIFSLYISGSYIEFSYTNTDLLTIGESYDIRIVYTANPARPIKVWIPENDDDWDEPSANAVTLGSFDTGTKTVIVTE